MRTLIAYATVLAILYEILYNQTGDCLYRAAQKLFIIVAAICIIIEIARMVLG